MSEERKLLLRITTEQFKEIYGIEPPDIFYRVPKDEEELWTEFMPSKLWRLNNLYTITDKEGQEIRFQMNWAQHRVYAASLEHPRIIVLKSRQQGISTLWLVSFFDDGIIQDNFEIGLMAQGQKEAKGLFRRVKRLWNKLPDFVKDYMKLEVVKQTSEEFGFNNGAMMYIQTSFRSGTLQRLHISEMGKIANKYPEKADEVRTGSLQAIKAGNTVVVESTAEGRNNLFYKMWNTAVHYTGQLSGKDFKPVFLSWTEDPDCRLDIPQVITKEAEEYFAQLEGKLGIELTGEQKWWWVAQKRELGDKMGQEYPGTWEEAFDSVRDGTYYSRLMREVERDGRVVSASKSLVEHSNGRISYMPKIHNGPGPLWDPAIGVEVAMDLGMNDTMVLVFFQRWQREIRLIDEYHNSGEGLSHYVNVMRDKPYKITKVWVPHDAKVRELGSGRSRIQRLRELGVRPKLLPKADVQTGIEQVRKMMKYMWVDADTCSYLIDMFYNYTKQWDDKLEVFKDKPLHNEWSNPADAVRYVAMSKGSGRVEEGTTVRELETVRIRSNVVNGLAL